MKCLTANCENQSHEGEGVLIDDPVTKGRLWFCSPCWKFIAGKTGTDNQVCRNAAEAILTVPDPQLVNIARWSWAIEEEVKKNIPHPGYVATLSGYINYYAMEAAGVTSREAAVRLGLPVYTDVKHEGRFYVEVPTPAAVDPNVDPLERENDAETP